MPSVDEDGLATEDTTIVAKDDPSIQIVIPEGFAPAILQTGTTQSLPGENGAVKEIMPVEEWNDITKEDINNGIVLVDNVITYDGGQPTGSVSAWNGPYYDENWQNGIQPLGNEIDKNNYWEDVTTQENKNIINSIKDNKGFYISRYEASQKDNATVQSKRGQNPWVNISQLDAITESSNMNVEKNSHLIYGIEWDSILTWLLDSSAMIGAEIGGTKIMTIDDIQKSSSSWGNYDNSIGNAQTYSGELQNTGKNEYWKVNNIYDLAGNVWEWTQENYSIVNRNSTRGGCYDNTDDNYPVSVRNNSMENYDFYDLRI